MAGLVVALVSGCASAVGTPAEKPAPPAPATVSAPPQGDTKYAPAWTNTDRRPIGQVQAIGSTVVGMVVDDGKLLVIGIDPATGHELWHEPATAGMVTIGVVVEVAKIGDDKVAYFRPVDDAPFLARLVVADARSGRDVAVSPPALFSTHPYACTNHQDACALSSERPGANVHEFRLEVATGTYLANSPDLPPTARLLESFGLVDFGDRPGNTMGWLHDGRLQWSTPISAAFPPGFSSDNGWTWHLFADQHMLVGSVFGPPLAISPRYVTDMEHGAATAGISETTGEVRWRDLGSTVQCRLEDTDHPVRCRRRGITTSESGHVRTFEGLDVTVEGFDIATGVTTWSVPLGPARNLADVTAPLPLAGPSEVVVSEPTGPVVLDYATGTTKPPRAGATYWCTSRIRYDLARGYIGRDGKRHFDRPGGSLAAICDALGNPAGALPGLDATLAVGAHVGSHIVVATPNGYTGFQVH
jgi:outer membrane protein assembly factor BamB